MPMSVPVAPEPPPGVGAATGCWEGGGVDEALGVGLSASTDELADAAIVAGAGDGVTVATSLG